MILQTLALLYLLAGAALGDLWRRRRETRGRLIVLTFLFATLLAVSTPAVVYPVVWVLERPYPPVARRPREAQAIVVLSGGILEPDALRRKPVLAEDTLYRCLHAAELYHDGPPCPVIVTGGALDPESDKPPVAPSMRDLLVRLGINHADVIVEPSARTTFENADECRKILTEKGLGKVILVTEAVHMDRALRCFRKSGVDAVPAACSHRATGFKLEAAAFIPTPGAIKDFNAALHEWLGLAWYRVRGRI